MAVNKISMGINYRKKTNSRMTGSGNYFAEVDRGAETGYAQVARRTARALPPRRDSRASRPEPPQGLSVL